MKKRTLINIAGAVWVVIGLFLLTLGMKFLITSSKNPDSNGIFWILVIAFAVGYLKGKFIFRRSVQRQVERIAALQNPSIKHLYSKGYYFLILGMMGLGMSMRFLPITLAVRGGVDVAIGCALLQGALHYFRSNRHPMKELVS